MKTKILIPALIVAFAANCMPAFAQDRGHDDDRGRGNAYGQRDNEHRDQRNDRNNYEQDNRNDHGDRGAGPRHDMRKGGHLSNEYRSRQYEVSDWRGHHLSAPPRGYHWVQTGSDYVLAAVATGLIAQVLLNN